MKRLLTLAAAGSLVAACTMDPAYKRPAAPVPTGFPQGASYASPAGGPAAGQVSWRQVYTDPDLQKVIALALEQNRDLRVAVANIQQAHAQFVVQRASLFPALNASGSEVYEQGPNTFVPGGGVLDERLYSASLGVSSWELDIWGRIRSLSRAAFDQYLADQDNRRALQSSLVSEVAIAWFTYAADQQLLQVAQQTVTSQQASLDLIQARFDHGVASLLDVQQARTTVEQARSDLAADTTAAAQAKNALDLLVGAPVAAELLPKSLPQTGGVAEVAAGLDSAILLTRPDVLEAEHKLMGANADIGAARANFFPTISLTGSVGQESGSLQHLFDAASRTWLWQPSVALPLFAGGKNVANLKSAKASRDAAVATYEKAVQTAFREVSDALARQGTIGQQIGAQRALVDASSSTLQLSTARYERGADTYLNVLVAQRTLYGAQQTLISAELTRLTNLVTLYQTLGGGQI